MPHVRPDMHQTVLLTRIATGLKKLCSERMLSSDSEELNSKAQHAQSGVFKALTFLLDRKIFACSLFWLNPF